MWSRKNRAPMRPTRPSPAAISASISPAATVAHVHLHLIVRLVVEQLEQQRQLASVLPNSHGRRRAVSTYHQRVRDVHSLSSVRPAARQAAAASASAPNFDLILSYLSLCKRREKSYKIRDKIVGFHDATRLATLRKEKSGANGCLIISRLVAPGFVILNNSRFCTEQQIVASGLVFLSQSPPAGRSVFPCRAPSPIHSRRRGCITTYTRPPR